MVSPQVYCDIEEVLMWFGSKEYSSSMPKVYRFTIYPLLLDYIMNMLSAAADAYELKEGRVEDLERHVQRLNSYFGFMKHRLTYAIRWRLFIAIPEKIKKKTVCVNMQKFRVRYLDNTRRKVA